MIVKIKSHKRAAFLKVLTYMLHNKDRLYDKDKRSFAVTHNLKGKSIKQWVKQYEQNEAFRKIRRKDSVRLTHEILSWHKDDAKHLSLEKLETLGKEYIRQRNPNGMYVVVPHFDKDHYHLHVCASGVEYKTGKSLRLSKPDLQKLKIEFQNYQLVNFPELINSVVEYGKKAKALLTDKEYQVKRRSGRETEKEKLMGQLKTFYKKAESREMFFEMLKQSGFEVYERGGKITGVVSDGIKFRFNRLGFTVERLQYLDRVTARRTALAELRIRQPHIKRMLENPDQNKKEMQAEVTPFIGKVDQTSSRVTELETVRRSSDVNKTTELSEINFEDELSSHFRIRKNDED